MGKWAPRKIEKCPTCGTILDPRIRIEKETKNANAALKRFNKKLRDKNGTSK